MRRRQPKKLGAGGEAYLADLLHVFVYTMYIEDLRQVSQNMRNVKGENGDACFPGKSG